MDEDASSALEINVDELALKSPSLTPQSCSPQALARINSRISSWRDWGGVLEALGGVCPGLGQQQMKKGLRGYKYLSPKTSR
jgi:hypothetical protein